MTHGFTVIQGGRRDATGDAVAGAPQGLRIDLHRAGTVDDGAVAAWRALMTRNAITDPRADPDSGLSAARHQPGGRRIAFALAWDRDGNGREALRGVMPTAMPHPAAALLDGPRADAVDAAIRGRLAGLRRPPRVRAPARPPVRGDARPDGRRIVPADCVVGVRPAGEGVPGELERVSDPARVAAAV